MANVAYNAGKWAYGKYQGGQRRRSNRGRFAQRNAYRARWGTVIPRRNRGYTSKRGYYGRYNMHSHQPAELKFLDKDVGISTIVTGQDIFGTGSELLILQNTTESGRIGRKITIKRIQWRFQIILQTQNVDDVDALHDRVSMIIYLDKQCNGAAAAIGDLWVTNNFQSYRNLAQGGRFRILGRKDFVLNMAAGSGRGSTDSVSYAGQSVDDSFNISCNIPIEYSLTTGAITEIKSNNIGFAFMSEHGNCTLVGKSRIRFIG